MLSWQQQEMRETLQRYEAQCRSGSVIVFGHCNSAQEMVEYLRSEHIEVSCFLDNNPHKQGNILDGIKVYSPEEIVNYKKEESIVLIITKFFGAMEEQLRALGYEGEIVEVVAFQSFQRFSTEEAVFSQKKDRVTQGYELLQGMFQQAPEDFFVICPFAALGDVYWALSYLPSYCDAQGISSCRIVVVGNGCREVAWMFGYDKIEVLDQKNMDSLVQGVVFSQEKKALIVHHDRLYTDPSLKILQHQLLSFPSFYKEVVYGLPETAKERAPCRGGALSEESKAMMPQKNTVIFAPYANSITLVSPSFWEDAVEVYGKKGFRLFTNVASGQEPLTGTAPLSLPLREMREAVEWAGHVVAMRSGLCDLIHGTTCEKTVVFPDGYFSGTCHKVADFFALEGWNTQVVSPQNSKNT